MITGLKRDLNKMATTARPGQPAKAWPAWATAVSKLKIAGEPGVGSTIERLANQSKLNLVAGLFEQITKKSCGCSNRKIKYDLEFPYID
jgi:hypothetical protein